VLFVIFVVTKCYKTFFIALCLPSCAEVTCFEHWLCALTLYSPLV